MEQKANSFPFAFVGNAVGAKRRRASAVGAKRRHASAVGTEGTVCPQKVLCANQEAYEIEQLTLSLSTGSETMGKNTVSGSATSLKRIF